MAIDGGAEAYYVERAGYYDVVVPDATMQCQLPTLRTFDGMPPDLQVMFSRVQCAQFETDYKHRLIRSALSDPVAT